MARNPALLSIFAAVLLPLCILLPGEGSGSDAGSDAGARAATAGDAPELHVVARESMTLRAAVDGRLEAATTHRVRVVLEAYTGPLHVERVHLAGGPIREGDRILELDPTRLTEEIEAAARQLAERELRLGHARIERSVLVERHARRLEQQETALARARTELEVWNESQGARLLKNSELGVRQQESSVQNQQEELDQLEQMYAGAELDSETKEIVLERARRALEIALERLELSRNDHRVTVQVTHPQRAEDVNREVGSRAEALAHLQVEHSIALEKKEAEIATLGVSLEESRLRSSRLRADLERLTVRSPGDGLLTRIELEAQDPVQARQVIARVHDPSRMVLRIEASAADLRLLRVGQDIDLSLPEYPEVALSATVKDISALGRKRSDETVFDVELEVAGEDPLLRLGLRTRGVVERTLEDVLTVPRSALHGRDGRFLVTVDVAGERSKRAVTIGPGDEDRVQVFRGLEAGESILLSADE